MFLIEYEKERYINAELIDWIDSSNDRLKFTLSSSDQTMFTVGDDCRELFVNHLNALSQNARVRKQRSRI